MQPSAIFAGTRVADFAWVGVGPMASQNLSLYGADVIRIESALRPDTFRNGGPYPPGQRTLDSGAYFGNYNQSKRGITLNLASEEGRRLARELIAVSDVVTESFTPGTMAKFGLDYAAVRAIRPDAVMISMSMAGHGGPWRRYSAFGLNLQAQVGFTHLTGWPDRAPTGTGVAYTDWVATHIAASALIAALDQRRRTGEGQWIDLSQLEASLYALDATLLDASANGISATRAGNRHPYHAPHGVYPCLLEENAPAGSEETRWIAIACTDAAQWQALCGALSAAGLGNEPRFATLLGRLEQQDTLDERIAAATAREAVDALERRLQAAGVPCSRVATVADVQGDAQLQARGHFSNLVHPVVGELSWDLPAYRLREHHRPAVRPAPLLGQDNFAVISSLLGRSGDELAAALSSGALS
jgi:benzylsuccinate CoA-transferase BbsF subunit